MSAIKDFLRELLATCDRTDLPDATKVARVRELAEEYAHNAYIYDLNDDEENVR